MWHVCMLFHWIVQRIFNRIKVFGHHPHTLGYLCVKFSFFHSLRCWASPWRKIVYSITHSPSLFDAPGTEACTSEKPCSCCSRSFTGLKPFPITNKRCQSTNIRHLTNYDMINVYWLQYIKQYSSVLKCLNNSQVAGLSPIALWAWWPWASY